MPWGNSRSRIKCDLQRTNERDNKGRNRDGCDGLLGWTQEAPIAIPEKTAKILFPKNQKWGLEKKYFHK